MIQAVICFGKLVQGQKLEDLLYFVMLWMGGRLTA